MERKPTHTEHKILEKLKTSGGYCKKTGNEDDIELYWELVKMHYLESLILMGGKQYERKFILTDKANEYLKSEKA